MLSYCWNEQPLILKVCASNFDFFALKAPSFTNENVLQVAELLREAGVQIWLDVDNMNGSTIQAMANAVDDSQLIIVCMSKGYSVSQNCILEAE